MLKRKETMPMMMIGVEMVDMDEYPKQAKEMPTARASILVATANNNWVLSLRGLKWCSFSSSSNDSFIILPPRNAKRAKAIQWS